MTTCLTYRMSLYGNDVAVSSSGVRTSNIDSSFTTAVKNILDDYDIILIQEIISSDGTIVSNIVPTGYNKRVRYCCCGI